MNWAFIEHELGELLATGCALRSATMGSTFAARRAFQRFRVSRRPEVVLGVSPTRAKSRSRYHNRIMQSKERSQSAVLASWKEIANYLGMSVRSVQRYEHRFHLPVRRPTTGLRGPVLATKLELDAWVAAASLCKMNPSLPSVPRSSLERQSLADAVQEMQRLRGQSAELRSAFRVSFSIFQKSLLRLLGEDHPSTPRSQTDLHLSTVFRGLPEASREFTLGFSCRESRR
jgi:hypothetical protein